MENIYVYNGADPIGDSDSIDVVIEYILPTSLGGTTLANMEWLIGAATPFKNVITLAERRMRKIKHICTSTVFLLNLLSKWLVNICE